MLSQATLPHLVSECCRRHPSQIAVIQGDEQISYEHLERDRWQVAQALLAMGFRRGDRIAIWAPNHYRWIAAAIGLQSLGCVLVPLNPQLSWHEARPLLQRAQVKALFFHPSIRGASEDGFGQIEAQLINMDETDRPESLCWEAFIMRCGDVQRSRAEWEASQVRPQDPMDLLFTSGTTGMPKGVLSSHEQNLKVFQTWVDTVGLKADDRYLIVNPFFHSFGYKAGWLACLLAGATALPASYDPQLIFETVAQKQVTVLPGAPALYEMLMNHRDFGRYDLGSLRLGVTGAASIPVKLIEDMKAILGFETVLTAYGLTESTGVVTMSQPQDPPALIAESCGRPVPGVEVAIVDPETNRPLALGERGEIWVRGYNVMLGYDGDEKATQDAVTADGWLRTGDIGWQDKGGYLRVTDRLKDMYIMNGHNVYPAEVEKALYGLEGVAQAAVIGVPQAPQGEVGKAFVVLASSDEIERAGASLAPLDEQAVRAYCQAHLARYKVPMYVSFVTQLPRNASGKVNKVKLRQGELNV